MVVAAAILASASCAHDKRAEERPPAVVWPSSPKRPISRGQPVPPPPNRRAMMSIDDAPYESWIAGVRECTAADVARAKPDLPGAPADQARRNPVVSIVGRLRPDVIDCGLEGCDSEGACCNGCSFYWVVVPRRCPKRMLRVNLPGSSVPLTGGGMDCAVFSYGGEADWVIATGQISGRGEAVLDADLCRLVSPATLEAKERMSDADLERLTTGARPDRPADCGPGP